MCSTVFQRVPRLALLRPSGPLPLCLLRADDGAGHSPGAGAQLPGPKIPGWAGGVPLPVAGRPAATAT